jgi:uncharacterized protein
MTENRDVVVRYIEAVRRGDADAVRASFTEDATWLLRGDLPIAGHWSGRDAIVDEFLGAAAAYLRPGTAPEVRATHLIAEGDQVVAEWTSRAVTRFDETYENHCLGVFTIRDGRIAAVREYMDTQRAARVLFAETPPRE